MNSKLSGIGFYSLWKKVAIVLQSSAQHSPFQNELAPVHLQQICLHQRRWMNLF